MARKLPAWLKYIKKTSPTTVEINGEQYVRASDIHEKCGDRVKVTTQIPGGDSVTNEIFRKNPYFYGGDYKLNPTPLYPIRSTTYEEEVIKLVNELTQSTVLTVEHIQEFREYADKMSIRSINIRKSEAVHLGLWYWHPDIPPSFDSSQHKDRAKYEDLIPDDAMVAVDLAAWSKALEL